MPDWCDRPFSRCWVIRCGAWAERSLRALAAEGAGQICRLALLQQDDANEKETNDDVHNDNEPEDNLHSKATFFRDPADLARAARAGREKSWCGGGDLNPYALRR